MNCELFSVDDSALFAVKRGQCSFWSPNEKSDQKGNITMEFSPPSSKGTFQQLRRKYQVALTKMGGKAPVTQSKSTRIRRRQSFAISQMLQNVAQINATPLKITTIDTERLVESMRKSTVKRKSMLPRSTKKSRVQALRCVSKNIDDIFAEHFAEPAEDTYFLTQPTPHRLSTKGDKRPRVVLLDRFDDDPFFSILSDSPPLHNTSTRLSIGTTATSATPTATAKKTAAVTTPRNSLCSPQPARTSAGTIVKSHAKSCRKSVVLGSAVRLRDQEMVTTSGAKANARSSTKPSTPSANTTRKSLSTSRQSIGNSAASTPMRAAVTPGAETPPFYTAAASVRRASIAPPTPTITPGPRKTSTVTFSTQKLKHTVSTPLTNLRKAVQTNVELSVEKMGAFLQSMRKNDLKNRHAALSVTKSRDCASAAKTLRKPRPSAVRTLTFPEGDSCLSPAAAVREVTAEERVERGFIYDTETASGDSVEEKEQEEEQEEGGLGDESMLMDDVLGIDVQQMLHEYSQEIAMGGAVAADISREEEQEEAEVEDVGGEVETVEADGVEEDSKADAGEMDISIQDVQNKGADAEDGVAAAMEVVDEGLFVPEHGMQVDETEVESMEIDTQQQQEEEEEEEDDNEEVEAEVYGTCANVNSSSFVEDSCMTFEMACAAAASAKVYSPEAPSPARNRNSGDDNAYAEPADEFTRLGNTGYNSDSSTSPQIVRLRYSAGSAARRSLSNPRGRLSVSAADLGCDISRLGVELSEQTSPLVFTAPVCKAAALLSAAVRTEQANADLIAPVKTVSTIATPRSMAKGPVRLLKSGTKSMLVQQTTGTNTPKDSLHCADYSDSDSELNTSAQSGRRVRPGNAVSGNARRKSLASVSVYNLIRKFQSQAEKVQKDVVTAAPVAHASKVSKAPASSEASSVVSTEYTGTATRSTIKASATKTKAALLQSPRRLKTETLTTSTASKIPPEVVVPQMSPRSQVKAHLSQRKAKVAIVDEEAAKEVVAAEEAEVVVPASALEEQVKKSIRKGGRKSTAKKLLDAVTPEKLTEAADAAKEATGHVDDTKENVVSGSDLNALSSLVVMVTTTATTKAKLSALKASVTKILASPAAASAPRTYSLRSASKASSAPVATAEEDSLPNNTAKVLFADEPDAPPTPARHTTDASIPKSTAKKSQLGPPERRVLDRATPKSTKKTTSTGAGAYTVAKVQRQERNQKLDSLFGTCEELLNLIDATVL